MCCAPVICCEAAEACCRTVYSGNIWKQDAMQREGRMAVATLLRGAVRAGKWHLLVMVTDILRGYWSVGC